MVSMESGEEADAILYLGPPETSTESPIDPATYLDAEYFKEMDRGLRCCMAAGSQTAAGLGWGSPAASAYEVHAILRLFTSRQT